MTPEIGKRYRVKLVDCCVEGEFTATVVALELREWRRNPTLTTIDLISFDNGVTLTNATGVEFEEAT